MTDSVLNYLDTYCEREGDPGLWGEPLNLITNLFFIVAAVYAARLLKSAKPTGAHADFWMLIVLMATIGVGSGLWHLMPNGHTLLMDVVPIGLFINVYLVSALRRLFGLTWWKVVGWWLCYTVLGIAAQKTLPPDTLNGTIMYIPTYGALAVITVGLWLKDNALGRVFAIALAVWTFSLVARTVDRDVCASVVVGTHFLWHTLNAWVLWRLTVALIGNIRK